MSRCQYLVLTGGAVAPELRQRRSCRRSLFAHDLTLQLSAGRCWRLMPGVRGEIDRWGGVILAPADRSEPQGSRRDMEWSAMPSAAANRVERWA